MKKQVTEMEKRIKQLKEEESDILEDILKYEKKVIIYSEFLKHIKSYNTINEEYILKELDIFELLLKDYNKKLKEIQGTLYVFQKMLTQLKENDN